MARSGAENGYGSGEEQIVRRLNWSQHEKAPDYAVGSGASIGHV